MLIYSNWLGLDLSVAWSIRGSTGSFLLRQYFSYVVSHPKVLQVAQYVSVESSSLTHHMPIRGLFVPFVDSLMV